MNTPYSVGEDYRMDTQTKWPKTIPPLTPEQQIISDDFMHHWHQTLASRKRYRSIEKFNHGYVAKNSPSDFLTTLEIGAGLGEHLLFEDLSAEQKQHYVALELRENMANSISIRFPEVQTLVADCQEHVPFPDGYFDRIIAIHILEHLPNLPAAVKELYRLCNKEKGKFSVVIPCEGGWAYSLARKISAQRIFERRYQQSYDWFIQREHLNVPHEILEELQKYFDISQQSFFPLRAAVVNFNLCIGLTLSPKRII
jgi:ubiquinone/menaquinone biosynthesis C-methylase UbiE